MKEVKMWDNDGLAKVTFDLKSSWEWNALGRIYINDEEIWQLRVNKETSYIKYEEEISYNAWDTIELRLHNAEWVTAYNKTFIVE